MLQATESHSQISHNNFIQQQKTNVNDVPIKVAASKPVTYILIRLIFLSCSLVTINTINTCDQH